MRPTRSSPCVLLCLCCASEDEWCSNRGLCDVATGVCNCMTNYDTSNGYAASGQRGDCGWVIRTISTSKMLYLW